MEQKLLINKLPARTWNRLGVNEASIGFDMTSPELPAEKITSGAEINHVTVTNANDSDIKHVSIEAKNGETVTVVEEMTASGKLAVETIMSVGEGAKIRLIQLHGTDENARQILGHDAVKHRCGGRLINRQSTLAACRLFRFNGQYLHCPCCLGDR